MNKLQELFKDVADAFERHAGKNRAASMGDIWTFVQDQLNAENALDPNYVAPHETPDGGYVPGSPQSWVIDIYLNDKGTFALVTKSDGKLYKVPVTVGKDNVITTGEYIEVFMEALPVTGRQVKVIRTATGQVRWFALPACTAVLNRSGEIDSRALFDSFQDHVMRTGEYPILDFYHMGESIPLGVADWVARDDVAYCASGVFYDTPIARAAAKSLEDNPDYWGLSIAYAPTSEPAKIRTTEGIEIPVYNTGINRFISLLPENAAASILTSISTAEEKKRMNEKVLEALRKLTGNDPALVEEFQLKIDGVNRNAQGMISRESQAVTLVPGAVVNTTTTPPSPTETPAAVPAEKREISSEDLTALLASDEFKAAVVVIVNETLAANAQAMIDTVEALKEEQRKENNTLRTLITGVTAKIQGLEKTREAAIQEALDDMPATPINRQNIVRPRVVKRANASQDEDLAARAEETLASLGMS
jgi:hypothetical protein